MTKFYLKYFLVFFTSTLSLAENGYINHDENESNVEMRIKGGRFAYIEEFPWAVVLQERQAGDIFWAYLCGGSIIHKDLVISAANCIDGTGPFRIIAGTKKLGRIWDDDEYIHPVESLIFSYRPPIHDFDIVILRLSEPIEFSATKNKINLIGPDDLDDSHGSLEGFVAGWGKERMRDLLHSFYLKVGKVNILEKDECRMSHNGSIDTKYYICGSYVEDESDRPCNDDIGNGLFFYGTNSEGRRHIYLAGVVVKLDNDSNCLKILYSRIYLYVPWIESLMKN